MLQFVGAGEGGQSRSVPYLIYFTQTVATQNAAILCREHLRCPL